MLPKSSGVDRTRPRYEDRGLGRVDRGEQEDPRQAKQGVLEVEEREKGLMAASARVQKTLKSRPEPSQQHGSFYCRRRS
jgi:hypothetical protein